MALKSFFSADNYKRLQAIHDHLVALGDPVLLDAVQHLHKEFMQKYAVYGEPTWVDIPLEIQPVICPELGPASEKVGRKPRRKKAK